MAQLELSVVLNLANFRTQLGKLAQASAAYYYPVNLTIDQRAFRRQLTALGNIKPVIKINDSQIEGARERVGKLNKSLATLRKATATPIEIKLKYVEIGKPPSAASSQIGRAVSGRVRAEETVAQLKTRGDLVAARNMMKAANIPVGALGVSRSLDAYRKSLVEGMEKAGDESVAGLAQGLKNGESEVAQAAKKVAEGGLRAIKDFYGIASPSRVFKQIGEFAVDGLELGFLNGLKDFKNKSVDEIRRITALLRFELAKISGVSMAPGVSRSAGGRGSRAYMSPIGPLPEGSKEPWAFSQYRYQPFMAQPGQTRGAGVPAMRERFPFAAAPSVMGTTTSPGMLGASFPALPSAGMTGGNAVRQAQLQSRMAAAYARSAAREASVLGESQMNATVAGQVPLGGTAPRLPAGNRGGALALRDAGAQTPLSLDYYKNAFKYSEALKVAEASSRNFRASQIPLLGGIKGLAGEFGEATKQVLLYGTAYKGLAFLTSLPGQILNAAKSQQQFANGLKVATQETGTFGKELLFVDNVQRAFGLNLQTTRAGFTRLYASMAPTGFDSGSIEKLFTGISAATASLQLTPDKAERVIYAFGQMASKGQIMSEELKGQLGDVLPGALAIFAKSAGMSVKEFSKAMEDGEFVGNRFREVFAKVSDELMNRFGTGAQAAGRSLQGLVNTVGGDFQRTLESFSPLANSAAQAILVPLGGSLKQLSISAQIATGEIERVFIQLKQSQQDLQDLRASAGVDGIITEEESRQIKAAEQNVAALTVKYKSLQKAASDPAIAKQAEDITRFTEELAKAGTFVMNVAKTIGAILSPALNFLGTNLTSVIGLITSFYIGFQTARLAAMALMGTLLLYRTLSAILGFGPAALSANALASAFNGLGIAATGAQVKVIGLRVALTALVAATVVGAVVAGIVAIASAFATMRDRAKEASQASRDAAKSAIDAAETGGVAQAAMSVQTVLGESRKGTAARKALEAIQARSTARQRAGVERMNISIEEAVALKGSALTEGMVKPARGGQQSVQVLNAKDFEATIRQFGSFAGQQDLALRESKSALATAQRVAKELGLNKPQPGPVTAETESDKENKKKTSLESYYSLQDQLAKAQTQADLDRLEAAFEHARAMVNAEYDLREARANSFQKKAIQFQKELFAITSEKDAALLKNRNKILAAAGSVAGGAGGAAIGGVVAMTGGAVSQDPLTRGRSSGPHLHAQAAGITEKTLRYLVDKYLEIGGKTASSFGQSRGSAGHGYNAIDFLTPQGTPIKLRPGASMSQYGPAGGSGGLMSQVTTPEGSFQLGHLSSLTPGGQAGIGAPGKVTGDMKRDQLAEQRVGLEMREASAASIEKEAEAMAKLEIATANYVQSLVPTAEQALQNQLLQQKITLTRNSFSPEILEAQIAFASQELEVAENIRINTERIAELTAAAGNNSQQINALKEANSQLKASLPVSNIQLLTKAIDEQVLSLVQRTKSAQEDAASQAKVNSLIIGGMTRQAAEAKVTADNLRNNYQKALAEATREVEIAAAAEEVLAAARRLGKKETAEQTAEYNRLAQALKDARNEKDKLEKKAPEVEGGAKGVEGAAVPKTAESYAAEGIAAARDRLAELQNAGYQVVQAANAIGDAFGTAFKGVLSGSMTAREALAGFFQSVADSFADMVSQMIAEWLKMTLIKGLFNIVGGFAGAISGGVGSAFADSAGGAAGFGGSFDAGIAPLPGIPDYSGAFKAANGGIAIGGFRAFANGGVVTGPTLGLVGEGRYNEAVIPLPDGKSVPVDLGGTAGGQSVNNVVVNVDASGSKVGGDSDKGNQLGRVIAAAVQQELVKQKRPGGILA